MLTSSVPRIWHWKEGIDTAAERVRCTAAGMKENLKSGRICWTIISFTEVIVGCESSASVQASLNCCAVSIAVAVGASEALDVTR